MKSIWQSCFAVFWRRHAVVHIVKWMLRRSFQILGCLSLVTRTTAVATVCRPPMNYYSKMSGEKGSAAVGVKYLR